MGGLGPGIGGAEYLIIAIVALLVVGPERLPMLLNKLGKWVAKARNMANEFRSSFDEMARQSELDELRKEVEALRTGQHKMMPLGAEADATFRSIRDDLNKPVGTAALPSPAVEPAPPIDEAVEAAVAKPKRKLKAAAKPKQTPLIEGGSTKKVRPRKKAVEL